MSRGMRVLFVHDLDDAGDLEARLCQVRGVVQVTTVCGFDAAVEGLTQPCYDLGVFHRRSGNLTEIKALQVARDRGSRLPVILWSPMARTGGNETLERPPGVVDVLPQDCAPDQLARTLKLAASYGRLVDDIQRNEERYRLAMTGTNDGIWDWDLVDDSAYFSDQMRTLLNLPDLQRSHGMSPWFDRIHPEDREAVHRALSSHMAGKADHFICEHRLVLGRGEVRWVRARGVAVRQSNGVPARLAGTLTDIDVTKNEQLRHEHAALHDTLTGLPNRHLFTDHLRRAFQRFRSGSGPWFAVLFLDLDRFKVVNDSLGHAAGDQLLKGIARRLRPCIQNSDTLARLGGDEFTVLLTDIIDDREARNVARRIRDALKRPFLLDGYEVHATCSIGIAYASGDYVRAEDLLRDADNALFAAKASGRARYEVFRPDMHTRSINLLHLERDLRRAIAHEEFELYYQPIMNVQTDQVDSVEALIRWNHPERGRVSPGEFIPLAEDTDLIKELGRWVLRESCRVAEDFLNVLGPEAAPRVTLNVSRRQVRPRLVEELDQAFARSPGAKGRIILEITESTLMTDSAQANVVLPALRTMGADVVIDDFGTGFSCLSSLARLDATGLKIDRGFIRDMESDDRSRLIVEAVLSLARSLKMKTTAEGIETPSQLASVRELGCELAQGFYFARPMPYAEMITWLERRRHGVLMGAA
jgi:diguanylate cyclase (GGDEF)-like protein/PAS domain S-box-containing protein